MNHSEQNIRTAARLYECRETARTLAGASYGAKVSEWRFIVANAAKKLRCDLLAVPVAMDRAMRAEGKEGLDGAELMWLCAAVVEEVEASK